MHYLEEARVQIETARTTIFHSEISRPATSGSTLAMDGALHRLEMAGIYATIALAEQCQRIANHLEAVQS